MEGKVRGSRDTLKHKPRRTVLEAARRGQASAGAADYPAGESTAGTEMEERMIPNNGTVWKARDGRIMRVEYTGYPTDGSPPWCAMKVLNPEKGMRRTTTMSTTKFAVDGSQFLRPHEMSEAD